MTSSKPPAPGGRPTGSLVRMSRIAIILSLIGLVVLLATTALVLRAERAQYDLETRLLALGAEMDAFSVAADAVLTLPPGVVDDVFDTWNTYLLGEIAELQQAIPDLARAEAAIRAMTDRIADVRAAPGPPSAQDVTDVAIYGAVMDAVLARAAHMHQAQNTAVTRTALGALAAVATLFALLAIATFRALHVRIVLPIRSLTSVAERITAGDANVRTRDVHVAGASEIARLGATLDAMLDRLSELGRLAEHQRDAVRMRARQLAEAQRIAGVGSWEIDLVSGKATGWSDEALRILEFTDADADDATPATFDQLLDRIRPEDRDRLRDARDQALRFGIGFEIATAVRRSGGPERPVRLRFETRSGPSGAPATLIGTVQDLSHTQEEEQIRTALLNALPAQVALLDGDGTILSVNDRWLAFAAENGGDPNMSGPGANYLEVCRQAVGDRSAEAPAVADGLLAVLRGERDRFLLEYPCHAEDRFRWYRAMIEPVPTLHEGGLQAGAVVMHVDVTDRKVAEERLQRLAFHDRLTDLASRHGFVQRVAERLDDAWAQTASVVLADVVNLRGVNDTHGFASGDQLLVAIGARLRHAVGTGGIAARTGGDQFAVFVDDPEDDLAQRVVAIFERPFQIGARTVDASARFGRTRTGTQPRSVDTLLREAEVALYHARTEAQTFWAEYDESMDRAARERVRLTEDLRTALRDSQFRLHVQPQVDLRDGSVRGCEALLRWHHPERGLVAPGTFIPVAERSGLIGGIGTWVVGEACRLLRDLHAAGHRSARIAVNVSIEQFANGTFPADVQDALGRHGIEASALTLEITESVFERESSDLWRDLRTLHELGVRLSLDDFGTGFSSLMYLKKYPFDEIKIDRAFVRDVADDLYSRKLVGTILSVSQAIGAEVVAEGIETDRQRDVLLELGVHFGQGFRYSVPLAEEDFRWLLDQGRPLPLGPDSATDAATTAQGAN